MFKFQFGNDAPEPAPEPAKSIETVPPVAVPLAEWPVASKRISYTVSDGLPRRDLFDVMYELKARAELSPEERFLLESNTDVEQNVYEGGLKVWEGTYDLLKVLKEKEYNFSAKPESRYIELGCGSGLPLCSLLENAIKTGKKGTFVFSDYNQSVLSLLTLPNVVLACLQAHAATMNADFVSGELEFNSELVSKVLDDLKSRGIEVVFVYGGWSPEFSELTGHFDLVLASETIYSLDSIAAFTDVLANAISPSKNSSSRGTALVAAKKIYFGVGGGVVEFERLLEERKVHYETVSEAGSVGRVVIECT